MKKRLLSAVLLVLLAFSIAFPALAADMNDGDGSISPRAHDVEYKREVVNTETLTNVEIGPAKGQPSNGTTFTSPGGFYWSDGGLFNSVTVSLGVTWGVVSTSISVGSTGGTTGQYISAPTNQKCKLYVYRDLECTRYANYERLIGSTGAWNFTGYDDLITITNTRLEVRYGNNFQYVWRG